MRPILILTLACLGLLPPARATDVGTAGAQFLKIKHGARPMGMGGAFTAIADDGGNAIAYNPAGLADLPYREVAASHVSHIQKIMTEALSVAYPISPKWGTAGFSLTYYDVPGLFVYDANGVAGGKATSNALTAAVSYGRKVIEQVSAGGTVKYLRQRFYTSSGQGVAFDVGVKGAYKAFTAGVAMQNWGPDFKIGGGSPMPLTIRGGLGWAPSKGICFSVEEEKARDGDPTFHAGGEWKVTQAFSLRAGWQQLRDAGGGAGLSAGLGYQAVMGGAGIGAGWAAEDTPWWEKEAGQMDAGVRPEGSYVLFMDYAFSSMGSLGQTHRATLGVRF